ncbi:glutamate synthase subunit beta, partial [Streptococcus sp. UBA4344]|uniref:glutamate synthase subunit beta n=1 Tax=Streptococcus sp. UBA4344 TaxID=1947564 RepID=UPI00257B75D8
LLKTSSFPEFTGRVCPALCEKACNCVSMEKDYSDGKDIKDPVSIHDNELYIIEKAFESGYMKPQIPKVRSGKKIAVVGSGPAGLAVADLLNRRGHNVTVFEREDHVGGLLMYGIPNMKLDKEIVQRRIDLMEKLGITFVANTEVGRDITADELLKQYDRVVLATGASVPRDLDVPGRHLSGVRFAVDFLTETTKNVLASDNKKLGPILEGKHVLVIGGGDTGNDCIGTAVRLGAASVKQLEITPEPPEKRLPTNPWPQYPMIKRVGYGQEEANYVQDTELTTYATSTTEFIGADRGQVIAAKTIKVGPGFKPIEGTEETIKADLVLLAMGFTGAEKSLFEQFGVQSVYDDYSTNNDRVFVAGDARRGPSLVIWGIREGRKAAEKIDQGLRIMVAQ